jgi:hypothetical protein
MLRKRSPKRNLHRGSGVQKQDPAQTTCFVLTRILQEAGKANKTVYAFFLDVRKAYDTV